MNRLPVLSVILVLASGAFAQRADPFDLQVANVIILQAKPVQKEVSMTEAQRAKLNTFAQDFNKKKDAFFKAEQDRQKKEGSKFQPNEGRLRSLFSAFRDQVLSQLTAKQAKRLRELTLQEVGMASMLDSHVAARLGITQAQLQKLQSAYEDGAKRSAAITQAAVEPIRAEFKGKNPNDKKTRDLFNQRMTAAERATQPKLEKIKLETRAKFNSILTAKQLSDWKALQGTPFKG